MTNPGVISTTLEAIESQLLHLCAFYEGAETEEERKATEAAIARVVELEIHKVDGIAWAIRHFTAAAEEAKRERDRIAARAAMWERRAEQLKGYVLFVLKALNLKRVDSPSNTLRRHGQADKVEIVEPTEVPARFLCYRLEINGDDWDKVRRSHLEHAALFTVKGSEFRLSEIRQALKTGPVPGARLLTGQEHIRVE